MSIFDQSRIVSSCIILYALFVTRSEEEDEPKEV